MLKKNPNRQDEFVPQIKLFEKLLFQSSPFFTVQKRTKILCSSSINVDKLNQLYVSYLEYVLQDRVEKRCFDALHVLIPAKNGLTKEMLLKGLYKEYEKSSLKYKLSLEKRLEKTIQRARKIAKPFGLTLSYSRKKKCYTLVPDIFTHRA